MKVTIKMYNGSKYNADSKEVVRVNYDIKDFRVETITDENLKLLIGCDDENNEYLILNLEKGGVKIFANSRVDMFKAC